MSYSRIFVTGGTGFIGSHVVSLALESGHHVRLSVRKENQIQQLKTRFAAYGERVEPVLIQDITKAADIQAALDQVEYIFHLASPMPGKGSDFQADYVNPAVLGTKAILVAAASVPTVKRLVIVSSMLALMPMDGLLRPGLEVKENSNPSIPMDMNMEFPEGFIGHALKYQGSKVFAHRATLDWVSENKPQFKLLTLHPAFVVGTDLTQTGVTPGGINALLMQSLTSEKPSFPSSLVDVRDVALAHLRALDSPTVENGAITEIILSGKRVEWDEVATFVKNKYPNFPLKLTAPFDESLRPDTERAERDLGIKWRAMEETMSAVLDQQIKLQSKAAEL